VLLVLIVLALFIRANSEKKRTNILLLAQKAEIEQTKAELIIQKQQILEQNLLLSKNNEKLIDLNNEKDGLVGIVAHDLRAPLNRIKGFAQILGFEENLNEDQLMMLKRIDKTCNAGIALIKDLLIINNIEYESTRIVKTDIEMSIFLKNFMEQFEYQASAKQIKLHLADFSSPIMLQTDENFIGRILDNILSNAIKFTHQNKNIYIKCEEIDDTILIAIRDEGQGLSKEDQQKLFIKFQKLSAKPTAGEESTGLGLAIVKALVDKLQGEISVSSKIDEGTEFTIKLPKYL
jgi:signal transduction histidine kinase